MVRAFAIAGLVFLIAWPSFGLWLAETGDDQWPLAPFLLASVVLVGCLLFNPPLYIRRVSRDSGGPNETGK